MRTLPALAMATWLATAAVPAAAQFAAAAPANPKAAAAPVDPARLAAATIMVNHVYPAGTAALVMKNSLNGMLDKIISSSPQMPLGEIIALSGQPAVEVAKLGKAKIADIMAIYDPAYQQRIGAFMHVFMDGMSSIVAQMEPGIREGMAQAYASRFTLSQLADMNRFFATPSGQAYAANAITIQTDPAVMTRIQAIYPVMMKQLPALMQQGIQATAKFPARRKFSELSPAERTKLAALLGVPESQLEANAALNPHQLR